MSSSRVSRGSLGVRLLAWGIAGVLALLLLWPMLAVLLAGFRDEAGAFTLGAVWVVLGDPALLGGLGRSLAVSAGATLLALAIAFPLAWAHSRFEFRGRRVLYRLLLLPLIVPSFVGAIGLRLLLARFGPLTQLISSSSSVGIDWIGGYPLLGVVVVQGFSLYPLVLLNLHSAFERLDVTQVLAARNLGVRGRTVFMRVLVPQLKPALFAGASLVAIGSFTDLGTPLVFHAYDLTAVQVFVYLAEPDNPMPYAMVFVLLLLSSALYSLGHMGLGRSAVAPAKLLVHAPRERLVGARALYAMMGGGGVVLLASLPTLCVLWGSLSQVGSWYRVVVPTELTLRHYATVFADDLVALRLGASGLRLGALGNSIVYAAAASGIATVLALGVAWIVARSSLRGRYWLDTLAMLPLAVPGLVLAFGYLAVSLDLTRALGEEAPAWLDVREAPAVLLILAYATRRLPYVVRSVSAGLSMIPVELERVSRNLGVSARRTLTGVTFPLLRGSVWAGASIAFFLSVLEVSDSLILAQAEAYYPVTRAIWELSQRLGDGLHVACALAVWAIAALACLAGIASASSFRATSRVDDDSAPPSSARLERSH